MQKRLPLGGGWNNYEGGFIYCFFKVLSFPQEAAMIAKKSRSEKIAAEKIAVRQGSTSAEQALLLQTVIPLLTLEPYEKP
jgi:hypothetical protein